MLLSDERNNELEANIVRLTRRLIPLLPSLDSWPDSLMQQQSTTAPLLFNFCTGYVLTIVLLLLFFFLLVIATVEGAGGEGEPSEGNTTCHAGTG